MGAEELPVRPMTSGEVLDAAVAVLRRRPARLAGLAVALAALEQVALYPLAHATLVTAHDYTTFRVGHGGGLWLLLGLGMGTEAAAFALLGGVASRTALDLLLRSAGVTTTRRAGARVAPTLVVSLLVGAGAAASFIAGGLPWVFWFMFTGLAVPALVIDGDDRRIGPFRAIGRSMMLVGRSGMRAGGLRLLGYLPWLGIRVLIGVAGVRALTAVTGTLSGGWAVALDATIWTLINAVAYAALACLDAVIHLEARMRLEGLDINLSRLAATSAPLPAASR